MKLKLFSNVPQRLLQVSTVFLGAVSTILIPVDLSSVHIPFIKDGQAFRQVANAQVPEPAQYSEFEVTAVEILDDLVASDFESVAGYFHPDFANRVSVEELEQRWNAMLSSTGDVQQILNSEFTWGFDFILVSLMVEFENTVDEVIMIFDENQQIIDGSFPKEQDTLSNIAEQFITAMGTGDYNSARSRFHPILKAQFSLAELDQGWNELLGSTGNFVQIVDSEIRRMSDVNVVLVTVEFDNQTQEIIVIFDDELQILGYDYPEPM